MSLNVSSLVRRHMKHSPHFSTSQAGAQFPALVTPEASEEMIGMYRNPSPWDAEIIVFSTLAIYKVDTGNVVKIRLDDIINYETPRDKLSASGVLIKTRGEPHFLRVAGRHGPAGRYLDAFALVRVLHVLVSLQSRSS